MHMGSVRGGHYVSIVKSIEDGNWYVMNDDRSRLIEKENIVSEHAYILFYNLRQNRSL